MSQLLRAEYRRRQTRAEVAHRSTEQDRFLWFARGARPPVEAMLHALGRAWGALDVEQIAVPRRSLVARLLGANPPGVIGKGYRVTVAEGTGSQGTRLSLVLGWIVLENGQHRLDFLHGREAGGLRVTIRYEDWRGGYFTLSATQPYLPAYHRTFDSLDVLHQALIGEWEQGTFVGPCAHYIPFHLHAR